MDCETHSLGRISRGRLLVRVSKRLFAALIGLSVAFGAQPLLAQADRPSIADSFRLGTGGGVLCQVQAKSKDLAIRDIFDRAWSIVCRDAISPIGKLYALRGTPTEALARLSELRQSSTVCSTQAQETVEDLGQVSALGCRLTGAPVSYKVLSLSKGKILWVAEGLAGYESALKLGLRTVIADRPVAGDISIATTSVDDPEAFARAQAGALDPDRALAEGYRRNNSGNYAEAGEFFDTLQQRVSTSTTETERTGEYLVNRALQKSNLGEFGEADALFASAQRIPTSDRVQTRLRRNFEAMHLLNQGRYADALARIEQPVAAIPPAIKLPGTAIEIGVQVAAEINNGLPAQQRLTTTESTALSPEERSVFLDAQSRQIRGTLFRLTGNAKAARSELETAHSEVIAVRDGRVVSVIRLRSQILAETALALEAEGDKGGAEAKMREALALLETRYPQTVAVNSARARLAALLSRVGKQSEALTEYKAVVQNAIGNRSATTGFGNLLSPYFNILAQQIPTNPTLINDMFLASQTLVRPGVADTQAILARELSEGTGEAASLFRQARALDRDVERTRIELATISALPDQTSITKTTMVSLQRSLEVLSAEQSATQARLSAFPQFRAISATAITLDEIQSSLKSDEAYFKLTVVGRSLYAIYLDKAGSTGYTVKLTSDQLDKVVDELRDTISKDESGQPTTYPFDIAMGRKLFNDLLGPVAARLADVRHLIFEPDGAMLRLPINLLVMDDASVDRYTARQSKVGADEYDFSGTQWLGRNRAISTVVAARAFYDARKTPASAATRQYLGFGQNAPRSGPIRASLTRSLSGGSGPDCDWPTSEWNKPISASELRLAGSIIGAGQSTIVTGSDFTDTNIGSRKDLADYRILHFATHGLVTAPRPQCPARPALLTSFGDANSDGLLSFSEIYDLKIDADLVILSACDTAGKASIAATREAGVTTGGGTALDGLVRAFIGAGGRSVLASHWPAPDEFKATERLISGLFQATGSVSIGSALATAQLGLMDDPLTSHPFYWSGFAIVGDSGRQMLSQR